MNINLYRLAYKNETGTIYDWFYLKDSNWRYYSHYTETWENFSDKGIARFFKEKGNNIISYHIKNLIEK